MTSFLLVRESALIRIREILDPDLKRRIVEALAARRGVSPAMIPEWFELDDLDFADLLNDLREEEEGRAGLEPPDDDRM